MSFDQLQEKILQCKNPTVVGLDPRVEYIPQHILEPCFQQHGVGIPGACQAIYEFNVALMDALCDIVPAVKPQSAYYENLGWRGMELLERTIAYAKSKGFFVIADVKRGDIGSTATAYAEGWLSGVPIQGQRWKTFDAHCVTLNGYMGSDSLRPFLAAAKEEGKCVFVLVKTSNPSSGEIQDLSSTQGLRIYQHMGQLNETLALDTLDTCGFTAAGAVVGATYPQELADLRRQLPHTFFLVPGYGAQGGRAQDVASAFFANGHGAIVNSSRGILCAWQKTGRDGQDFAQAAREAALAMRQDLTQWISFS